jgi:hypothetical protein
VSSLHVVPMELAVTSVRVSQTAQTLAEVAHAVAAVHGPDTGTPVGSGQLVAVLHQLAAAVQSLSTVSLEESARLRTAGGAYLDAERRAGGGRLCE